MAGELDPEAELALRLAAAADHELDGIVGEALELLACDARAERAYVTLFLDDGTLESGHEWTSAVVARQRPAIERLRAVDFPYSHGLAVDGEILDAPDLSQLPDAAGPEIRSFSSFGVRAVLQVPIMIGGRGVGVVGVNAVAPRTGWDDELVERARRTARALAVSVGRELAAHRVEASDATAERATRFKDEIFEFVSHELRTPLHAILGYAELLELDERTGRDRDALMQIQVHGRNLVSRFEDLVELAERSTDDPTVDVDVGPVVGAVLRELAAVGRSRRVSVSVAESVDDLVVRTGRDRLRRVLYGAVSGTLQSMSDGTIVVEAAAHSGGSPGVRLRARGARASPDLDAITPPGASLIEGYGTVEVEYADGAVDVVIRFDQPANP